MARHTKQEDQPIVGLDKLGEPIIDPAPDKPPTWEDTVPAKTLFRGGTWGAAVGLVVARIYMSSRAIETSFGPLYPDNLLLVLGVGIGAGFALGAFIGWLSAKITGKNKLPPTSIFDE
jgi:hypothetical protein